MSVTTPTTSPAVKSNIYLNDPKLAEKNSSGAHMDMTVMALISLATAQTLESMGKDADQKTGGHHKKDKANFLNELSELLGKQAKVITASSTKSSIGDFDDIQNMNSVTSSSASNATGGSSVHLTKKELNQLLKQMQLTAQNAEALQKLFSKGNHAMSQSLSK